MATTTTIHQLPLITIQHDLPNVVEDIKSGSVSAEDIWISCYRNSPTPQSVHGKVRLTSNDINNEQLPCLEPRDGIQCKWTDHSSYSQLSMVISCESLSIEPTIVIFPIKTMKGIQPKGIECMDVAGDWLVTGGKNGYLRLDSWKNFINNHKNNNNDSIENNYRIGRGHVSDILSCQFFPSGEVILTTSIDMSARIYSIDSGGGNCNNNNKASTTMMNIRTFSGPHGRSIPTATIIDRGKEIITACKDGKIRLWNVSQSKVIIEQDIIRNNNNNNLDDYSNEILCMKISKKRFLNPLGEVTPPPPTTTNQLNQGGAYNDKFLAIGLSSGALNFIDIPSLKPIKCTTTKGSDSGITALAISETGEMIAYGTRRGVVTISTIDWQLNTLEGDEEEASTTRETLSIEPFATWSRTDAAINALEFSKDGNHLLVASNDGLPYRVNIDSKPFVLHELAGFDCDPVISARIEPLSNLTFLAGKDASILIY